MPTQGSKVAVLVFTLMITGFVRNGLAEESAVPNGGSPYVDPAKLPEGKIVHVPTGVAMSEDALMNVVSAARVIYIGESHDNLEAHRVQAEVIRRLSARNPGKIAVGMEMFRRTAQPELDLWHDGKLTETQFRKLFGKNWGGGYALYQPVFDAMQENRIPLLALKSTLQTEEKFRKGEADPAQLPEMDDTDVYHKAFAMSIFGGHGKRAPGVADPYRMLLLWEETMAQTVADFLRDEKNRDTKLIVLAGGFHVEYGFGIPKRAFRRLPHAYAILLPVNAEPPEEVRESVEMDVKPISIPLYSADFAWKIPYNVLPPNKIKLGVMLEELDQGLRVITVEKDSNAGRAGVLKDDVLLKLEGGEIVTVDDLATRLQTKNFGDTVTLLLRRGARELTVTVELLEPEKK